MSDKNDSATIGSAAFGGAASIIVAVAFAMVILKQGGFFSDQPSPPPPPTPSPTSQHPFLSDEGADRFKEAITEYSPQVATPKSIETSKVAEGKPQGPKSPKRQHRENQVTDGSSQQWEPPNISTDNKALEPIPAPREVDDHRMGNTIHSGRPNPLVELDKLGRLAIHILTFGLVPLEEVP